MTTIDQKPEAYLHLRSQGIVETLIDCAIESAVNAFLVLLMGGIAIDIIGGLARDMIPSAPPGARWNHNAPGPQGWLVQLHQHQFAICFALLFVPTTYFRLKRKSDQSDETKSQTRLHKIGERLAEGWFALIVGNAFGAMVAAIVIDCAQNFSFAKMLYQAAFGWASPHLHAFAVWIFGPALTETIDAWLAWYRGNQLKFTFWLVYVASVCDDLGIPNLKSLARWACTRFQKRRMRKQIRTPNEISESSPTLD
jgi:hypothetical protein